MELLPDTKILRQAIVACVITACAVVASGCVNDPAYPARTSTVLAAANIPASPADTWYELWFDYPDDAERSGQPANPPFRSYVSAGKFKSAGNGSLTSFDGGQASVNLPAGYSPQLIGSLILTLQVAGHADTVPGARLLAGAFDPASNSAQLTLTDPNAFTSAFTDSISGSTSRRIGKFILDTPTTPDTLDYLNGIWFVKLDSGHSANYGPGIQLPALNTVTDSLNWIYESWITQNTGGTISYLSLGRFTDPYHPDANGAGPSAGPDSANIYFAPGEDFVRGQRAMLNNGTYGVLVSLQPKYLQLNYPFIPLLKLDTIPSVVSRLGAVSLRPVTSDPSLGVTFAP